MLNVFFGVAGMAAHARQGYDAQQAAWNGESTARERAALRAFHARLQTAGRGRKWLMLKLQDRIVASVAAVM